jgi:hypothetical protein
MKLSAPKTTTFYIAAALAIFGFLGSLIQIPVITGLAFWLVLVGFVVLALSVLMPNL